MTLPNRRIFSLMALSTIVALLVFTSLIDSRNRIVSTEKMMISQGRSVVDIIAESSLHGIGAYNNWEKEVSRRLINNARWVAHFDSAHGLNEESLARLAGEMNLNRILVFDAGGGREMASYNSVGRGKSSNPLPDSFLKPLLSGTQQSKSLGFRKTHKSGERRFVVGVSRSSGGAIVVNVKAETMTNILKEVGPGHLIKALGDGQGVKYIVLQDENGIQASSTSEIGFQSFQNDPTLIPLVNGEPYVTRAFLSELGEIFEVNRFIIQANGSEVLLRVGLDGRLLTQLRSDIKQRMVIRSFVFVGAMVLAGFLLLAWQKQALLDQEIKKIGQELKAKEEEARRAGKLVAMGNLAAGVAHQIRNPLNSIYMIAQMIRRQPDLPDSLVQEARHIRDESARIEKIVQQFLEFAKPRETVMTSLDLSALVTEVARVQSSAHEGDAIEISLDLKPVIIILDRNFMIEVLENLIRNAAQALSGEGKIKVSLRRYSNEVQIVVADNGPGIAPAIRDRIFDLYYTSHEQGSGLGLSLSTQMVAAMGGRLEFDDGHGLEGQGARFVIHFPNSLENEEQ